MYYWQAAVNCAMIILMVLGWNDVCSPLIQIWPLLLLVADAAASSVFCIIMAQGFELHNKVHASAEAACNDRNVSEPTTYIAEIWIPLS